jgi:hypothetical protein
LVFKNINIKIYWNIIFLNFYGFGTSSLIVREGHMMRNKGAGHVARIGERRGM